MKMHRCFLLFFFVAFSYHLQSQTGFIKGIISGENNQPVPGASVILRYVDSGAVIMYRLTNNNGVFIMDLTKIKPVDFLLEIRHISYRYYQKKISFPMDIRDTFMRFTLYPRSVELKEVVIKREPPMVIKSDTVQFNAGSFRNAETRKVEDLLKNINGFSIDASGRISFNGKEVEKVLIEGDDLSDKGYRMITKNLTADIIDKVQVIDNYNDNRLLRNVSKSDKVGINLKLNPGISNRISGSLTAGLSAEKRYLAEGSLVYIGKPFKMISYVNANNIAEDPSGNVRFYYSQEGGQENYQSTGSRHYNILSAGSIFPPDINDRYRQDNQDAAFAVMSSWKLGAYTKMKAIAGADWLRLSRRAYAQNNTYINDIDNWATINDSREASNARDNLASFSLHRDALKNHITHIDLDLGLGSQKNSFSNLSSGSLIDTLTEKLTDHNKFFYFKWEESLLLTGKKIFTCRLVLQRDNLQQLLDNKSGRFAGLYGLDSTYSISSQGLDGHHFKGEFSAGINGNQRKWGYESGIRLIRQISDVETANRFTNSGDPHDYIDTGRQSLRTSHRQVDVYFNSGWKAGRKGFLSLRSLAGYAFLENGNLNYSYPVIKTEWAYAHAISLMRSVQVKYTFSKDFSNFQKMYPPGLISGNGNLLNGTDFCGTTRAHTWTAGYHSSNVYKNSQWSLNLSYSRGKNQYNSSVLTNPSYTVSTYAPFDNNYGFIAAGTAEKFFSSIKSKLGCSVIYSRFGSTYEINGDTGFAIRTGYSLEGRWSTGYSFPLNLESKARIAWSEGRWEGESPNTNRQFHVVEKLKFSGRGKTYAALVGNYYILSAGSRFIGLDAFIHYRISQDWKLSLTCSNLFNSATIREKSVMAFSNTVSAYDLVGRYVLFRVEVQL